MDAADYLCPSKTFGAPISARDFAIELASSSELFAVDAGAPLGLAYGQLIASPKPISSA